MEIYFFYADGYGGFSCEADNNLNALRQANDHFGSLPQGIWMERIAPRSYRWALGNFFD
jgi:hypothetical protein